MYSYSSKHLVDGGRRKFEKYAHDMKFGDLSLWLSSRSALLNHLEMSPFPLMVSSFCYVPTCIQIVKLCLLWVLFVVISMLFGCFVSISCSLIHYFHSKSSINITHVYSLGFQLFELLRRGYRVQMKSFQKVKTESR